MEDSANNHKVIFDFLKVIGAFGIVWYHCGMTGKLVGYSGLIIFILLSIYFQLFKSESISNFLFRRSGRLLIPWIFWVIIYGIKNTLHNKSFFLPVGQFINAVLMGSAVHLWFLPFIFIMSAVVVFTKKYWMKYWALIPLIGLITLLTAPYWRNLTLDFGYPWALWFHALPCIFIALAFFHKHKAFIYIFTSAIFVISTGLIVAGYPGLGIPYLLGTTLFAGAILSGIDIKSEFVPEIAGATFGVYLIHPLIYSFLKNIGIAWNILVPIFVFLLSLLISLQLRKIKIFRYVM